LATWRQLLIWRLAECDAAIATALERFELPQVSMLRAERRRAIIEAERDRIDAVLAGLRNDIIAWSCEEMRGAAAELGSCVTSE
jgi:hypothetical protein